MIPSIDQTLHLFANLLPNWTLIPILTILPKFWGFHRTLQRVRLANRGRLLLRTPGPVPFGTCICSNVETILSWTCHVYGPFEFRTSLGTSILLILRATRLSNTSQLLEQGYVKERLKLSFRKFYSRCGDLVKQYEVPLSRMLNDLWYDQMQWRPGICANLWTFCRVRPFAELLEVSIERLRRVWHAGIGRLLLQTPDPVQFGTCMCSSCCKQSFSRACYLRSDSSSLCHKQENTIMDIHIHLETRSDHSIFWQGRFHIVRCWSSEIQRSY